MRTKQEQIEELRSNIYYARSKVNGIATSDDIAEALYDVGYRKVPDDIRELIDVLAEGANKYKNLEIKYSNLCDKYRLCKDANETLKQNVITARKETAEAIYNTGHCKVDEIQQLKEENACLLKACEEKFTFDTTQNKKYSVFNSVRKEFADSVKVLIFQKGNPYDVPFEEFVKANVLCGYIDELLKEYEK